MMPTVESLLKDNVTLKVECIDRLYLNGYVPRRRRRRGRRNLWWFLHEHRGCPVISPVLVKRLTDDFVRKINRFAEANAVPVVHFVKGDCKEAIAQKKLEQFEGEEGVVMIGVAQEKISSFRSYQKDKGQPRRPGQPPCYAFYRGPVHVKQYFKLERALRTETTINNGKDFQVGKRLGNLDRLRNIGRNVNHRLLNLECVAQHCAIASQTVERVVLPTVDEDNHRAPALRWGEPRVMALFSAICCFTTAPEGFTNRNLRRRVGMLHDPGPDGYTASRMSYDLAPAAGQRHHQPRSQEPPLPPDRPGTPDRALHDQVLRASGPADVPATRSSPARGFTRPPPAGLDGLRKGTRQGRRGGSPYGLIVLSAST